MGQRKTNNKKETNNQNETKVTQMRPRTAAEREADKKNLQEKNKKLKEELSQIEQEENQIREEEICEQKEEARKRLEFLRVHKEFILSLLEHSRTSCSDEHPCNGYSFSEGYSRCETCHLIEILNGDWGDDYEIDFSVSIREIN